MSPPQGQDGEAEFTEGIERGWFRGIGEGGLLLARQREALSTLKHPRDGHCIASSCPVRGDTRQNGEERHKTIRLTVLNQFSGFFFIYLFILRTS